MIEAMACGTPVLAFRCGSVPEIIDPGVTACTTPPLIFAGPMWSDLVEWASATMFTFCSNGKCTRMPMLCTPWLACAACAPSLAACIRPGLPLVMMSQFIALSAEHICLTSS
jgi:glycosyl transferase family 1